MDRHGEEVLVHDSGDTRSPSMRTLLDASGAFVPLIVTFDTWVRASVSLPKSYRLSSSRDSLTVLLYKRKVKGFQEEVSLGLHLQASLTS